MTILKVETFAGTVHYLPWPKGVQVPTTFLAGQATDRWMPSEKALREWLNAKHGSWMKWEVLDKQ